MTTPHSPANAATPALHHPHALAATDVVEAVGGEAHGLSQAEAERRLGQFGRNSLPRPKLAGPLAVFIRQFMNPLIYILLAAAMVSLLLNEWADALFIFAVLLLNAVIGAVQEHTASRSAAALRSLVVSNVRVMRDGEAFEVNGETLVPGDVILLESGVKVPADLRLLSCHGLEVDESLLTGESIASSKAAELILHADTPLADRDNMAFAGTLVVRGRGLGIVTATGQATELGRLAEAVLEQPSVRPPLLTRLDRFTVRIAILIGLATVGLILVSLSRGAPLGEVFILAVALAVSTIPEGLPVALTVALAIGMNRMAKRHVVVHRLVAAEALGSCTFIASDKTGTLTVNQLTVKLLALPCMSDWEVGGEGTIPEGGITAPADVDENIRQAQLGRLCRAAVLNNEAFLGQHDGEWRHHGDAVDVALLVLAHKAGISRAQALADSPELASIPFEPERAYSASLNQADGQTVASVKGALERLLPMCSSMQCTDGSRPLDLVQIKARAHELAAAGYRVLALAAGPVELDDPERFNEGLLKHLTLLGLVGMIDPLRPEAKEAIAAARRAGVEVSIVTGDHPVTALAIARELGLADDLEEVVTGEQLRDAERTGPEAVDGLTRLARVFARVEPQQKLDIVHSLQRNGHFVAVTGDGANDAPALRAAHVGVAMGRSGTDMARETAGLILTDDNFASIIAGIEEGRIAYANMRKVIFLLISTGAAELVLFTLALLSGLPLPLTAVQLLWLNLVTNGIQDIALAFEPAEGDELRRPPRSPREAIFNRIMIERVLIAALVIGGLSFLIFQWLLAGGYSEGEARNGTLLLMVLFENVHVFNSRSETLPLLRHNPLGNRLLLFGTAAAQLVHIAAMYTPGLSTVLGVQPVSPQHWTLLLGIALIALLVMETHKWLRNRWPVDSHSMHKYPQ